jgi:hypothetical protein
MKKLFLPLATFVLLAVSGCQQEDEIQPISYDALALGTGHWEWESTAYMGGKRTPATQGFTRQLLFGANGQLSIYHSNRLNKQTAYVLSMGTTCSPSQPPVPIITYETDSDVPNNDRKSYTIIKTATGQSLSLVGEAACADAGAYETYHWVKE